MRWQRREGAPPRIKNSWAASEIGRRLSGPRGREVRRMSGEAPGSAPGIRRTVAMIVPIRLSPPRIRYIICCLLLCIWSCPSSRRAGRMVHMLLKSERPSISWTEYKQGWKIVWVHLVACYLIRWLILSGRVLIRSDINMERKHQFTPMGNRRRKAALRGLRAGWWPNETRRVGTILKRCDAIWKSRYVPIMHLLFRLIWWPFLMSIADMVDMRLKKSVTEQYVLSSSLDGNHESQQRCKIRTAVLNLGGKNWSNFTFIRSARSKFGGYQ